MPNLDPVVRPAPSPAPGLPPRAAAPWPKELAQAAKMVVYFVLLSIGVRLVELAFGWLAGDGSAARLSRVSALAASILDMNKNFDELLVVCFTLLISLLLVAPVSWVLKVTRTDDSEPSLTQTLVVLAVIVAAVTGLLQDSLARSFGLVGVVAAVRYRNTLRDSKDAVYVFLALGIGMACGLHAYPVAFLLSLFSCTILMALWLVQRRRLNPGDAELIARLKAAEKRGERTPAQALAWLTPQARERLEADLTAQSRYITMAAMLEPVHGRRPNAAITVQTTGSHDSRDSVAAEMADHRGDWRLLSAEEANGVTTLEYLGWVARRKTPPLKFLERLQRTHPDVTHVTFRSLRKMVADKVEVAAPTAPVVADGAPAQHVDRERAA